MGLKGFRQVPSHLALPFAPSTLACFKTYLGFVVIRYGKLTDTKTAAFERRVFYSQFPRGGAHKATQDHMGQQQGRVRRRSTGGRGWGAEPFLWFSREGVGKQDGQI